MKSFNKESKNFAKQNPSVISKASELGVKGYNSGIKAPFLCKECMRMIEEFQGIEGATLAILSAWTNASQAEHVKEWDKSIIELKNQLSNA